MPRYVIERTVQGAGRLSAEELPRIVPVTGVGRFGSRLVEGRRALEPVTLVLVAILACLVATPTALATPGRGNSAATITASFADSCRNFAAHSSKDVSHVEIHYLDGRVVKDESIRSHDYAIVGGAGGEIEFAVVKSGTTSEQFDCVQSNSAPTALLEIKTPPIDRSRASSIGDAEPSAIPVR